MEQVLPVEGGGKALLYMNEGVAEVIAEHPDDGLGLYKAWLRGGKGGQILVGTLTPEGQCLKRRRRFSVRELELKGCWPVKDCKITLAFPFEHKNWYCEQNPERLIADPLLRGQIKGAMMCCRDGNSIFLAVPFRKETSVVLDAAFCLGKVETIHGVPHIVWEFNKSGLLQFPDKAERTGKSLHKKG